MRGLAALVCGWRKDYRTFVFAANIKLREIRMTDWAEGIETRNYGIKCVIDARIVSDLVRTIICLGMVAGALLFYSWVRNQIIYTGYESQKLYNAEKSLRWIQNNLIVEEKTLSNPERIDLIARNNLEMVPLNPNQFILPQVQNSGSSASNKLALVNSESIGLKKSSTKRTGNYAN
jgi:cell division protein FtsL